MRIQCRTEVTQTIIGYWVQFQNQTPGLRYSEDPDTPAKISNCTMILSIDHTVENPRDFGSATAITIAHIFAGFPSANVLAADCSVAPVVMTSSTRITRFPKIDWAPTNPNAPRIFSVRRLGERCVCDSVARIRVNGFTNGTFAHLARCRATTSAWLNPLPICFVKYNGTAATQSASASTFRTLSCAINRSPRNSPNPHCPRYFI